MSQTAFAIADNSFQNSSIINEKSSALSNPDQLLLQDEYADRIAAALQQRRDSAMRDTEIAETTIEDLPTSNGIGPGIGAVIDLPDVARLSRTLPQVSFHLLQEWEGYVIEIGEDDLTVRLLDSDCRFLA